MNIDISKINKNTLKFIEILSKNIKMTLIIKYIHCNEFLMRLNCNIGWIDPILIMTILIPRHGVLIILIIRSNMSCINVLTCIQLLHG